MSLAKLLSCENQNNTGGKECFGHGVCTKVNSVYHCECVILFSKLDNCEKGYYNTWALADLSYPLFGFVFFGFVSILLILEILIEVRRLRKRVFKVVGVTAKFNILLFCLLRIGHFALWLVRDLSGYEAVPQLADVIVFGAGTFVAVLALTMVVVLWTTLIDKVKNLANDVGAQVKAFRRGLIIAAAIFCPLLAILWIVQALNVAGKGSTLATIYNVCAGSWFTAMAIVQFVYNLKVVRVMKGSNRLTRRNNFLFASSVLLLAVVLVLTLYPFTGFRDQPWTYFGYQFVVRFLEVLLVGTFYGVTELYLFDYGLFRGYLLVFSDNVKDDLTQMTKTRDSIDATRRSRRSTMGSISSNVELSSYSTNDGGRSSSVVNE
jgi:hypothetical protein